MSKSNENGNNMRGSDISITFIKLTLCLTYKLSDFSN